MRRTGGWIFRMTAMLAAVGTLTACYEWTARPGDMRDVLQAIPSDRSLDIVRADHRRESLARPHVVGDTLFALETGRARDGELRKIPIDSVLQVVEGRLDGGKTLGALALAVGGALLAVCALFAYGLRGMGD